MRSTYYIIVFACVLGLGLAVDTGIYTSDQNKTYFIETRNMYNFFGAMNECKRRNMTLLIIDSAEKSQEIINLINENFKETDKPLLYIGANDLAVPGRYIWAESALEIQFTNWSESEPNNYENREHCVHIGLYDDGTWNDVDCYKNFGFICENNGLKDLLKELYQ